MTISVVDKDIYIDQFDRGIDIEFKLYNNDGTDYDLKNCDIQFIVKNNKQDDDSLAIANSKLEYIDGVIVLRIDKILSEKPVGTYYYAIRLMNGTFVNTIVQAKLKIINNTFESGV